MKHLLVAGAVAWVGLGACVLLLVGADLGVGYVASEVVVLLVAVVGARGVPTAPAPPSDPGFRSCLAVLCVSVVAVGLWTTAQQPRLLATLVGLGTALAAFGVAVAGLRPRGGRR